MDACRHHLANTIELFLLGDDAVLCLTTLTTYIALDKTVSDVLMNKIFIHSFNITIKNFDTLNGHERIRETEITDAVGNEIRIGNGNPMEWE